MEITLTQTGQKILFNGLDEGMKLTSMTVPKGVLCWVWVNFIGSCKTPLTFGTSF